MAAKRRRVPKARHIHWQRSVGQRRRLVRLAEPADATDPECVVLNVVSLHESQLAAAVIPQQQLTWPLTSAAAADVYSSRTSERSSSSSSRLEDLPCEVLWTLLHHLSVKDIEAVSQASDELFQRIHGACVLHLMLPAARLVLEQAGSRRVLRLTSSCCLFKLVEPVSQQFVFANLNLKYLKELKLVGCNYSYSPYYATRLCLSVQYKRCLCFFIDAIHSSALQKLEFLIDESVAEITQGLQKFVNLREVIVHGVNSTGIIKQIRLEEGVQSVLDTLLANSTIRVIRIKNIDMFGSECGLNLVSQHLEEFEISYWKKIKFGVIDLPRLTSWTTSESHRSCDCLLHAEGGTLKEKLWKMSPNLRFYNSLDLRLLVANSGMAGMSWHQFISTEKGAEIVHSLNKNAINGNMEHE